MRIYEAIEYYERTLKGRVILWRKLGIYHKGSNGKSDIHRPLEVNMLVLDFPNQSLGLVELSLKETQALRDDLPKHKDLESFDWQKLSEQYDE